MIPRIHILPPLLLLFSLSGCTVTRSFTQFFTAPLPAAKPLVLPKETSGDGVRIWWIGHATTLIQIEDKFILTDPVFTSTVGALSRRIVAPGLTLSELPDTIDATLVSHAHFDHLSRKSLKTLASHMRHVVAPRGIGRYIPSSAGPITELSAWEHVSVDGLRIYAVPAEHTGWRWGIDSIGVRGGYTSYILTYRGHTIYFGGDTAWAPEHFAHIKSRFAPIDVAILPIAPAEPRDVYARYHLGPEEGVDAMIALGARRMIPIHWGTFHHDEAPLRDPIERATRHAVRLGREKNLLVLEVGEVASLSQHGEMR